MEPAVSGTEIAIIGMAGRYPKSKDLDEFWQHLRDGDEMISFFTDAEMQAFGVDASMLADPRFVKAASVLDDIDLFDAALFDFTPREAELLDPQHRLFLECCWEALENAGYDPDTYEGLIGVYAGAGINTYFLCNLLLNPRFGPADQLAILLGSDRDYMMTRASYKLNLRGPSLMIQAACSTSLVATHVACQSLLNEECDIALAGASNVQVQQRYGYYAYEGGIYSPDGHCRAFDAKGQGTIFGSGVGIVVLKRLEDALADGDTIHAIIKGSAVNNDGAMKANYTVPSVSGQADSIAEALANAGVSADSIAYLEAHGTATPVGDSIEIQALTRAFRATTERKQGCAIGSVKTNVGHLDQAAGVTGLIKTVLCLKNKLIAPSLHFQEPNPAIDFENSPFYVNATLSEWPPRQTPRRAGVSSFGIGGTNAHVILQEAGPIENSGPSRPSQLIVLSAKTPTALESLTDNLTEHLKQNPGLPLADVAYTLQVGRKAHAYRRIAVASDVEELASALQARDQRRVFSDKRSDERLGVAFMFPGQGAQYVNMGLGLYRSEPAFREPVDSCSERLRPLLGLDLRRVLYPDDGALEAAAEQLKQTRLAQPALFVVEYALAQLWREWGVRPDFMIGHSIGEYVAACLAGVFSLEDALALVAARARLMQELPTGAMSAVPLPESQVVALLPAGVSLAAVNAPNRCVVSGRVEAVAALERRLLQKGIACRRLVTSHAFHSEMMEPVLEPFIRECQKVELRAPQLAYLSNVTGDWIDPGEATDPTYWAKHLRQPVRFAEAMSKLLQRPGILLLEAGPGQMLNALVRQQSPQAPAPLVLSSMRRPQDDEADLAVQLTALGKLWLVGGTCDGQRLYANQRRHRVPLPTYPFERKRYWVEPASPTAFAAAPENGASLRAEVQSDAPPFQAILDGGQMDSPPQAPALPAQGNGNGHLPAAEMGTASAPLEQFLGQQLRLLSQQVSLLRARQRK